MTEEKKETKENFRKTTLGELGLKLPIYNGSDDVSFDFKEWDMETEEELADLQAKSKNVGEFVRQMMNLLLNEFNGKDWDSYSNEEKILLLSQLHFPNMMYMYMALRVEELGHELAFDMITCPSCKQKIENYIADLRTLDVVCKDKEHEQFVNYELKRPIVMEGGKTITGLKIGVTKWGALEAVPAEKARNGAVVKRELFKSSVEGALNNGEPFDGFVDLKAVISKIKKIDIEKIGKVLTDNNGGPDMVLGGECPHCKTEFEKPIDWGYEIFFDSSSL